MIRAAGYDCDDVTYAVLTLADGAIVNLAVSFALPAKYPSLGYSGRIEILGTEGVLMIDDDHLDQLMYTERGIPHIYVPDHTREHGVSRQFGAGRLGGGRFLGAARERDAQLARSSGDRPRLRARHRARCAQQSRNHAGDRRGGGDRAKPVRLPLAAK